MAIYNESLIETVIVSESLAVDVLAAAKEAIGGLTQDELRWLTVVLAKWRPVAPGEPGKPGEPGQPAGPVSTPRELRVTLGGFVAEAGTPVSAEEAQRQIVGVVPRLKALFSSLEASCPGIKSGLIILALSFVLQRSCVPGEGGSSEFTLFQQTINNNITITSPPHPVSSTTILSPLARVVLAELRKIDSPLSREVVSAATTLSPQDDDLALAELAAAGVVTEITPGVFALREDRP